MNYSNPRRLKINNQPRFSLKRALLPTPVKYYTEIARIKLIGGGVWKSARCPFHHDSFPSLRINMVKGGYKCMVCEARGGDIIDFHMAITGLRFIEVCKALGALDEGSA